MMSVFKIESCVDHLGNTYETTKEMCNHWNINCDLYMQRIKAGWSLEKSLTTDIIDYSCTDHLGNVFNNIGEMCRHWKISENAYRNRLHKGWSLEKALTTPGKINKNECTDHLGNVFKSEAEMCRHWGITYRLYYSRIHNTKWSVEKALTTPVISLKQQTDYSHNEQKSTTTTISKYTDHLGNTFKTAKEMCKAYGIRYGTYKVRINSGWSVEKALTTTTREMNTNDNIDHKGNVFKSQKAMCDYWNADCKLYRHRIKLGMSKEEALTLPKPSDQAKLFVDPITGDLLRRTQLCKKYNVKRVFEDHLLTNFTIPQLCELSIRINPRHYNIDQTRYNLTVSKRIKKGENVFECYIDNGDGTSTFRIMSQDMIDEYCIQKYKEEHGIQ